MSPMRLTRPAVAGLVLAALWGGACRPGDRPAGPEADGRLGVFVSIPPQKYFVERIGGPHLRVGVLLKPGQSMHTYEPTPRQMVDLAAARVYFRIGAPFERQVADKVGGAFKNLELVDVNEGIALRPMSGPCEDEGETTAAGRLHLHDDHDGHGEMDLHTWMSPRLAKVQAAAICRTLTRLDPAHRADYERNLAALEADLDRLDAEIAAALRPLRGRAFFVFHPGFGYFADAYGLTQVAIESGGKQPTARQLAEMIDRARGAGVRLIFVQPQFSRRGAEAVAQAIGGAVVPLDHLAEDYVGNLRHVAAQIRIALEVPALSRPAGE